MIGIGEYNFCFCRSAQGFAKLFFSRSGLNPYPAPRNRVVCAHLTKSVFKVSDDAFFKLQSKETKIGVQRRYPPPRIVALSQRQRILCRAEAYLEGDTMPNIPM